jgi:hypothetical protein
MIALEIRVPTGTERHYIDILERIYELAETEETIIPTKLGKFFPYYMKSKLPEVFNFLMRQQNADMESTSVIPIFGYTTKARNQKITLKNEETTVELALATTNKIIRIEATPSTRTLHKYLVIIKKENQEKVTKEIRKIFALINGPLANQPQNFPIPRCGGSEKIKAMPKKIPEKEHISKTTLAYMVSLEMLAMANNPQDTGPTSPPKRHRKFTISYATAAKSGFLKEPTKEMLDSRQGPTTNQSMINSQEPNQLTNRNAKEDNTADTSQLIESSLSRSLTNLKTQTTRKDIDSELMSLETRMDKQEEQMSAIVQVIKSMNEDIEQRMAHAILAVLVKEKEKIQELTHGRVFKAKEAPLANENGNLPFGGKVQLGGPLDRLHHVEVTVQQMASALDAILDHMQKDSMAQHLFQDDSDSETPTIIEHYDPSQRAGRNKENQQTPNDVQMPMREYSGSKRLLPENSPLKNRHGPDPVVASTPQRSPPSKKERSETRQPSAKPECETRERGQP